MEADARRTGKRSLSFDDFVDNYYEQVAALVAGGVDLLAVETGNDILVLKACLFAIDKYCADHNVRVPTIVSGTIYDQVAARCSGETPEAFYVSVSHFDALSVGFNCGVGVDLMRSPIESWRRFRSSRSSVYPKRRPARRHGGLSSASARTAPRRCSANSRRQGWINIVGGCCGTTPGMDRRHRREIKGVPPRRSRRILPGWSYFSGNEVLVVRPETNFVMVGERCNITGSLKFKRLIKEGQFDAAIKVARDQVEGGANILDVNMDADLIDGKEAMTRFLHLLAERAGPRQRADHGR